MEASALRHPLPAVAGRSPLLRLQSDEKLVALIRRGHHGAFEALVQRYQPRLLAFCRHMLGSQEDAEDVLQEVFAASFNALLADDRPINARPWLYRIARNRCLNHLRRPQPLGQDEMDLFERDGGVTTADTVHRREEFRQIVSDVQELPETQRTALLLREIDALSYDQIAEAMETTVPSVKSLLVRARVSLAEAAEARLLTCGEVRLELGQVAEGIAKTSAPVRRHLKSCERCRTFRTELRNTSKALAAVFPVGLVALSKKLGLAKLGFGGAASSGAGGAATSGGFAAAGGAVSAAAGGAAGSALSAGIGTLASKTAAGMAAAAIVTAGAVEVRHATRASDSASQAPTVTSAGPPIPAPAAAPKALAAGQRIVRKRARIEPTPTPAAAVVAEPAPAPAPAPEPVPAPAPEPAPVQEDGSTVTLPPRAGEPEPEQEPSGGVPYIPPSSSEPAPANPAPPPSEPAPSEPEPSPPADGHASPAQP